jgi:hypothetical protein
MVEGDKGKKVGETLERIITSLEGEGEAFDVFNINREDLPNFFGLGKDIFISLYKMFKWFFHELNMTNVRVRGVVSKTMDIYHAFVQTQIDSLLSSLKTIVEEMLKMK